MTSSTLVLLGAAILGTTAVSAEDPVPDAELPTPLSVTWGGFWKTRSVYVDDLFLGQADATDVGIPITEDPGGRTRGLDKLAYLEHQLRLSPEFSYGELLRLRLDFDVLNGVIWGDNNAVASLPLFASDVSNTQRDGTEVESIAARRVWLELKLPVGLLKVGRQPSHWGMGLLAHNGDGLGSDFGDYRNGNTVDRILFATRPLQIVKTVMKEEDPSSNLVLALAFDKIVDDALTPNELDRERECIQCAPQILLARPNDDVNQFIGVLLYKDEEAQLLSAKDLIQAGAYLVHRVQPRTHSKVWIVDGHAKLRAGPYGMETELIWISGESSAITGEKPKDIDIRGGAVRLGYYLPWLEGELELGHAPGDDDPTDRDFKGFPFHPDYNVGLLMYEEVLAARTARSWTREQQGLWSKGGAWNSRYVQPKVRYRPIDGLTLIAAFLWARALEDTNAIWFESRAPVGGELDLGYEVDFAARYDFFDHAHLKVEGGVYWPGKALWRDVAPEVHDLQITEADRADVAWTVQGRLGFEL